MVFRRVAFWDHYFFLVSTNDFPNAIEHKCVMFADDITLFTNSKKLENLEIETRKTINKAISWLQSNDLKINLSKTKIIQFQTRNQQSMKQDVKLTIDNLDIENVDSTKFLGIFIDKYCNWKTHIDSLCSKLDRFVYVIRRLRETSTIKAALLAYHGYISSMLRYGIILWGNCVEILKLFRVQKKIIRAMCNKSSMDTCKPLFLSLKILTLPCLYIFEIGNFVKKKY